MLLLSYGLIGGLLHGDHGNLILLIRGVSIFAVVILVLAGLPSFFAEAKFSGERFRVFQWRSPLRRMLLYLEIVLAREDHAKEVKLFNLGPSLMRRYKGIFDELYQEEKRLTIRRDSWGFALGLLGSAAFYGAYVWVALATIGGAITLGRLHRLQHRGLIQAA